MPRRKHAAPLAGLIATLIAIVVAAILAWPHPVEPPGTLRVASWNLRKFTGERRGVDYARIRSIIEENGFHVIAVQELFGDEDGLDRLSEELGGDWRGVTSARSGETGERLGFLYDARRVELLDRGFVVGGGDFLRRPYVARFRSGGFDFSLVNVHLPSGDADRRRDEAGRLAALVDRAVLPVGTGERDVIVLGDFNTTRRYDNSVTPFASRGWVVSIDEPTNLGDGNVLDNVLWDAAFTGEALGRSGVVRFDDGGNDARLRESISDHRPVWSDFDTTGEDDD